MIIYIMLNQVDFQISFSEIDNLVDSSSENPGAYRFEKAISGYI